jgi:hypothetical protein
MLNKGQQSALSKIINWYNSPSKTMILEGKGGTGKTYLLDTLLRELNVPTLLLAPTHEAVANLKDKVKGEYIFKTCHSALGVTPTFSEKDIDFKHQKFPDIWGNISLAVVDEASMSDDWMVELFSLTDVKILYVGHSAQLPPVKVNRSITDTCISPVFAKGYPIVSLTEPMRNTGEIWDFLLGLEENISTGKVLLKTPFDVSRETMKNFVKSPEGVSSLKEGDTKFVLWTNKGVSLYNERIRSILWKDTYKKYRYVAGDRIILTSHLVIPDNGKPFNGRLLKKLMKWEQEILYTNTKGLVLENSKIVEVFLEHNLTILCYKITFQCLEGIFTTYEPISEEEYEKISKYYERLAWSYSTIAAKNQGYKFRHFVLSCFAKVHHYYAATAHRLQGATIPNIIFMDNDVRRNPNPIERAKCRYVGCSRASKTLRYYHG